MGEVPIEDFNPSRLAVQASDACSISAPHRFQQSLVVVPPHPSGFFSARSRRLIVLGFSDRMVAPRSGVIPGTVTGKITLTRKQERKNEKKLKKLKKVAHSTHKPIETLVKEAFQAKSKPKKKKKTKAEKRANRELLEKADKAGVDLKQVKQKVRAKGAELDGNEYEKLQKEIEIERRKRDREKIVEDEEDIRKYGKLLGYNKRKSKNLPSIFLAEGMDGLLTFCDSKDRSTLNDDKDGEEELLEDVEYTSDMERSDLDLSEGEDDEYETKVKEKSTQKKSDSKEKEMSDDDLDDELEDEDEEMDSEMDFSDEEGSECDDLKELDDFLFNPEDSDQEEAMNEEDAGDEEQAQNETEDEDEEEVELGEDIYGRTINKRTGQLIENNPAGARKKLEELEDKIDEAERLKIERSVNGIVNRLSESTMVKSKKDLHDLFMANSKNEVKRALTKTLLKIIRSPFRLQESMAATYALFLGLLHGTCSSEISAYFVEKFLVEFVESLESESQDKSMENQAVFIAQLTNFRIVKGNVVLDVLNKIAENVNVGHLQMILLICSYAYRVLKKQLASEFNEFLNEIGIKLQAPEVSMGRAKFIGEEITALKKGPPKSADYQVTENFVKTLHGLTKKTTFERELGMSLQDLLNAEERGRWWIVGSAFKLPDQQDEKDSRGPSKTMSKASFAADIVALAKKAGMNTETRRNIFCSVVSASDEDDAFERLLRLNLSEKREREIVHILINMLLKEKAYNEFYPALVRRFCEYHKRFVLTTQYALWDRLREVETMKPRQRSHFAHLLSYLLVARTLPITLLKVVEWGTLLPTVSAIMKKMFELISKAPPKIVMQIFQPIIDPRNNRLLSDGARLFLQINFEDVPVYSQIENMFATFGY